MSSFSEFSKNANHGDMNTKNTSKASRMDIAKNRIDPNTGNEREDRDAGTNRERVDRDLQGNNKPQNRERSQDRNQR